jgi:hypothetical protein
MNNTSDPTVIYVAGPMTGYPEFNYPAFDAAERALLDLGYGVLNPTDAEKLNDTGKPQEWAWYMRHALRMVVSSDGLAVLPGWEKSRGALLEVYVAQNLGLPVRPIDEWLNNSGCAA